MTKSQIEVTNIRFGKLEDNSSMLSQKIAIMSYKDDKQRLNAITPEFITETCGIPREGPYYKTDRSRAFFKMHFCRGSAMTRLTTLRSRRDTTSSGRSTTT